MAGLVKVHRIFTKTVVGGEIHAAAKPENRCQIGLVFGWVGHKVAHIHMYCGAVWVARVHDQ